MNGIQRENKYRNELIESCSLRWLSHGELKRMAMFLLRLNGAELSAFPGKNKTEECTGLDHKLTDMIDLTLGKMGFLLKREEITVKGGKTWKYYLNPEVPKITNKQAKEIRKEVRDLLPPHLKNSEVRDCSGEVRDFSGQVRDFWARSEGLIVLKSATTILNHNNLSNHAKPESCKAPQVNEEIKKLIKESTEELGRIASEKYILKWLKKIPEPYQYRIKAFIKARWGWGKGEGGRQSELFYNKAEDEYFKWKQQNA